MKAILITTIVFSLCVILQLIICSAIILQNFIFTNKYVIYGDISYYTNPNQSNIYGYYWWLYASDLLRFLIPFTTLMTIPLLLLFGSGWTLPNQIVVFSFGIFELAKLANKSYNWAFCSKDNFCRGFSSTLLNGNGNPNSLFKLSFFSNAVWIVIIIGFAYLTFKMEKEAEIYRNEAYRYDYNRSVTGKSDEPQSPKKKKKYLSV